MMFPKMMKKLMIFASLLVSFSACDQDRARLQVPEELGADADEYLVRTEITHLGKRMARGIGKIYSMDKKTMYASCISSFAILDKIPVDKDQWIEYAMKNEARKAAEKKAAAEAAANQAASEEK